MERSRSPIAIDSVIAEMRLRTFRAQKRAFPQYVAGIEAAQEMIGQPPDERAEEATEQAPDYADDETVI